MRFPVTRFAKNHDVRNILLENVAVMFVVDL